MVSVPGAGPRSRSDRDVQTIAQSRSAGCHRVAVGAESMDACGAAAVLSPAIPTA